jgi:hypothetical protein
VPRINWQGRMDEKIVDTFCKWMGSADFSQLTEQDSTRFRSSRHFSGPWFDNDHRALLALLADSNKRRPGDRRVLVENRLAWDREHRALRRLYPMCFAAAEPKSPNTIQVADITHAMPNA